MASFDFNNGNITVIRLGSPSGKIFVSVSVEVEHDAVKIAGHSVLNLDGELSFEDVQFEKHPLMTAGKLNGRKMVIIVDVSKFKVEDKELMEGETKATCTVKFFTKNEVIRELVLDDSKKTEPNTVFNYLVSFSNQ